MKLFGGKGVDAVVIGAGWDGLAAALRLARSGRRVVLTERREQVGGIAAREEFHPGFATSGIALPSVRCHPDLDEVLAGLARDDAPVLLAAPEGRRIVLRASGLEGVEPADTAAWTRWRAWIESLSELAVELLGQPAPDVRGAKLGELLRLAKTGWRARRLGERELLELARVGPMCSADLVNEWFADPLLRAGLCGPALEGTFTGPWSPGTATNVLLWEAAGAPPPSGGPAAITAALEQAARAAGVDVRTGCEVRAITFEEGRLSGVETDAGEALAARAVVATEDPRRTLLELVPRGLVPAGTVRELQAFRQRGTTAVLNVALSKPFEVPGAPDHGFSELRIGGELDDLERAFDAVKYRRASTAPQLDVRVPSRGDSTLAPSGSAVLQLAVHFAPRDVDGGWTDAARDALRDAALEVLERCAPGTRANVVATELLTPLDLEQRYGLGGGHVAQGELALDQLGPLRPASTCARGTTPIPGLFLAGPGVHPGPFLAGGAGCLAARALLAAR